MNAESFHRASRLSLLVLVTAALQGCAMNSRSAGLTVPSSTSCDRACLTRTIDNYLAALERRDPTGLQVIDNVRFTENGTNQKLGQGLWRTANSLGRYRIYIIDPDSGAVAVQTVLKDGDEVIQLQVRLRITNEGISEIETLIARAGDTCCWAPEQLDSLSPVFTERIPIADRMTREQLVAAADAYFTALHTAGTSEYRRVAVDPLMNRYENGKRTTNVLGGNRVIRWDAQSQLDQAMFGRISVVNRRYPVIDTESGSVLGIVVFEYPNSDRPSEIISEFFKIAGGSIREIRAIMVKQPSTGWPL